MVRKLYILAVIPLLCPMITDVCAAGGRGAGVVTRAVQSKAVQSKAAKGAALPSNPSPALSPAELRSHDPDIQETRRTYTVKTQGERWVTFSRTFTHAREKTREEIERGKNLLEEKLRHQQELQASIDRHQEEIDRQIAEKRKQMEEEIAALEKQSMAGINALLKKQKVSSADIEKLKKWIDELTSHGAKLEDVYHWLSQRSERITTFEEITRSYNMQQNELERLKNAHRLKLKEQERKEGALQELYAQIGEAEDEVAKAEEEIKKNARAVVAERARLAKIEKEKQAFEKKYGEFETKLTHAMRITENVQNYELPNLADGYQATKVVNISTTTRSAAPATSSQSTKPARPTMQEGPLVADFGALAGWDSQEKNGYGCLGGLCRRVKALGRFAFSWLQPAPVHRFSIDIPNHHNPGIMQSVYLTRHGKPVILSKVLAERSREQGGVPVNGFVIEMPDISDTGHIRGMHYDLYAVETAGNSRPDLIYKDDLLCSLYIGFSSSSPGNSKTVDSKWMIPVTLSVKQSNTRVRQDFHLSVSDTDVISLLKDPDATVNSGSGGGWQTGILKASRILRSGVYPVPNPYAMGRIIEELYVAESEGEDIKALLTSWLGKNSVLAVGRNDGVESDDILFWLKSENGVNSLSSDMGEDDVYISKSSGEPGVHLSFAD